MLSRFFFFYYSYKLNLKYKEKGELRHWDDYLWNEHDRKYISVE